MYKYFNRHNPTPDLSLGADDIGELDLEALIGATDASSLVYMSLPGFNRAVRKGKIPFSLNKYGRRRFKVSDLRNV